jgi:hypothetical protein
MRFAVPHAALPSGDASTASHASPTSLQAPGNSFTGNEFATSPPSASLPIATSGNASLVGLSNSLGKFAEPRHAPTALSTCNTYNNPTRNGPSAIDVATESQRLLVLPLTSLLTIQSEDAREYERPAGAALAGVPGDDLRSFATTASLIETQLEASARAAPSHEQAGGAGVPVDAWTNHHGAATGRSTRNNLNSTHRPSRS